MKRTQNAKAAARRLAQVMATQSPDDGEEEDELLMDIEPNGPSAGLGLGLAGGRPTKNRAPVSVRKPVELPSATHPASGARPSVAVNSVDQQHPVSASRASAPVNAVEQKPSFAHAAYSHGTSQSKPAEPPPGLHPSVAGHSSQLPDPSEEELPSLHRTTTAKTSAAVKPSEHQPSSAGTASQSKLLDPIPSIHSSVAGRSSQSLDFGDKTQPPAALLNAIGRSPSNATLTEQPMSTRSVGRSFLKVKTAVSGLPTLPLPNKAAPSGTLSDSQRSRNHDKKFSLDFGISKNKERVGGQPSALQDELDMLQEENDSLLEKLRIAEERCQEAESRTRQLEKQIVSLGEGVSLEARLLNRKEADIQKREAALRVASISYGGGVDEIVGLRMEAEAAKEEAKSLQILVQRMILTQDEMEEVVLKRSWLARCWSLCVRYGIHADIAESRYEYWSAYASRPLEVILGAGRKAKDENSFSDLDEREKILEDKEKIPRRATVEHMLLVEKGLRELNLLKVEEAIAISMAQTRCKSMVKYNAADDLKLPSDGYDYSEAFELSQEEAEDVFCKQAVVMYLWRRTKNLGLEPDIADERIEYWMKQGNKAPNSNDAVDVERALLELQKLGIETKLWEESRTLIDPDNVEKTLMETEEQMLA